MPYQKIRATWISLPALLLAACGASLSPEPGVSGNADVVVVPMLRATAEGGFSVAPLFTVGEEIGGYRPPGVPDGMAAFARDAATIRVYVNHELAAGAGYPYALANGTVLTGARMSWFDVDAATRTVRAAGPAWRAIRDRAGREVVAAGQINELGEAGGSRGLHALCSAAGYARGERGFVDDLVFTHEEATVKLRHPHGGTVWALDVASETLWALPELGRGSWENSVAVATPDMDRPDGHVALLLGDDYQFGRAPLYLWVGRKRPGGNFVERNGLAEGRLHVWVADNGDLTPQQWSGSGTVRRGRFVPIGARDPAMASAPGHDPAGYLDDVTLRARAEAMGVFLFSRPEDLHADPAKPTQVVFASTGHGTSFPADDWGDLYLIDMEFPAEPDGVMAEGGTPITATLTLLHDSDETGDHGLRNPDNVVWAADGFIYVQEDKAVRLARFGAESGMEASIWRFDPRDPSRPVRIAVIDRGAVPHGMTDPKAAVAGEWESSGIIDLSALLDTRPGEVVLLATVQAHGVRDGAIGGRESLVEAGQLLLLSRSP